jgi:hypothetical protein
MGLTRLVANPLRTPMKIGLNSKWEALPKRVSNEIVRLTSWIRGLRITLRLLTNWQTFPWWKKDDPIRNSAIYRETGINVNFVADRGDWLEVATYERGVENETLSCGTGVTASAIAAYLHRGAKAQDVQVKIQAKGGNLEVRFHPTADEFAEVWLCGPARRVYAGIYVHA